MNAADKAIVLKHAVAHRADLAAKLAGVDSFIASLGGASTATAAAKAPKGKRVWTEEQKQAARDRLANARAAKAAKAAALPSDGEQEAVTEHRRAALAEA